MPLSRSELADRLRSAEPLLLDGATGTELERRGVATRLPLWSAAALDSHPETIVQIHADYVAAGVDAVTANTFRTQRRTLVHAGLATRAADLTHLAVDLARRAAGDSAWVFGSSPTLEDCYRPERVPDDGALAAEHREHARHLADAGVDAVLVETMNTIREACAAVRSARATGLPVAVSFACGDAAKLLSGEPLTAALAAVAALEADLLGVNCLPPAHVAATLEALGASQRPFAVYANLGAPLGGAGDARTHDETPAEFAAHARRWIACGARVVGGCCGTRPAHIRAIAEEVRDAPHDAP
jgi:S-methylmethionine-dependent homocysteine/selenocysteine methylase